MLPWEALASTPIASHCLLLVTGTRRSQMVVIERTPTRFAIRHPEDGAIFVTNDHVALRSNVTAAPGSLQATSCRRCERIRELVQLRPPARLEDCLDYLADDDVRMTITVQQMAPQSGAVSLRIP